MPHTFFQTFMLRLHSIIINFRELAKFVSL